MKTFMYNFTRTATAQEVKDWRTVSEKLDTKTLYDMACFIISDYVNTMMLAEPDEKLVKDAEDFAEVLHVSVKELVNWLMVYEVY